jgi:hypothetical protein
MATDPSRKTRAVLLKLSEIEYQRLSRQAARQGVNRSDWLRTLLRAAAGTLPLAPPRDLDPVS